MEDKKVLKHIEDLIAEEERLLLAKDLTTEQENRLHSIKLELDQYWDYLRQRQALRGAGENPADAKIRASGTVENYEQ